MLFVYSQRLEDSEEKLISRFSISKGGLGRTAAFVLHGLHSSVLSGDTQLFLCVCLRRDKHYWALQTSWYLEILIRNLSFFTQSEFLPHNDFYN